VFLKGNKYGKGRPKICLNKPELLLPIIFQKSKINWAEDFAALYKQFKRQKNRPNEKTSPAEYDKYVMDKLRFEMYLNLMPYLCTKINIKDLDSSKFVTEGDKQAMTDQTAALLEALENESKSTSPSKTAGMANGTPQIPPTA
jgi:hypothetical protein